MEPQRTLGIDLSASPENTAACLIRWGPGGADIEEFVRGTRKAPLTDELLIELIERATKAGIDAPFGWPLPFVEAVRDWEESSDTAGQWPKGDDYRDYRWRLTDRQVVEPRPPLSVSTDLIGVAAMRCAGLLSKLGEAVDRSGEGGPVIEVYPAASLVRWQLPAEGYKKAKGKQIRLDLVAQLCERLSSFCPLSQEHRVLCEASDDAVDALVAALVVRAHLLGHCTRPADDEAQRRARIEGWIHLPTCSLEDLAG